MSSPFERDIKNITDRLIQLRKDVDTCNENAPKNTAYNMIRLVLAYRADTKFSQDPLFKEMDSLLKKFSDNCACNKIGRFKIRS